MDNLKETFSCQTCGQGKVEVIGNSPYGYKFKCSNCNELSGGCLPEQMIGDAAIKLKGYSYMKRETTCPSKYGKTYFLVKKDEGSHWNAMKKKQFLNKFKEEIVSQSNRSKIMEGFIIN